MGGTVVARVDGIGVDIFELLTERLHRNRQAFLTETRWSVNIRSYRQPTPPLVEQSFQGIFTSGSYSHERQDSGDDVNESGSRSRQRIMYTVRNSAGPDGLVAMVEDVNAPTRSSWRTRLKEREIEMKKRKAKRLIPSDGSLNVQLPDSNAAVISHSTEASNLMSVVKDPLGQTTSVSAQNPTVNISTDIDSSIAPAHEALLEDDDSFLDLPPEPPRHFRISLACFPESFEHLLSNTLISAQGPPGPALWVPRSHATLINGVIWGLYSTPINLNNVKHDEDSPSFASQMKPDYWIRIGKLTTKGTSNSSTSLPWIILEAN
ncbi:uncharacterized protein MELLADRAFT_91393 [Melampsora larici-populina 98AG31]|uniref:Uncharacterized protein n=1 Tax=Melampsora larici-populina (strain 98AG31 / pathotype 3-4-7) TaxID=747676 RepID=F4RYW6_MELLP|nr:uncharacterized protein MELLADRAFT_91393 [Melampsora larici-populina 98AG31]EGG02433.1 hypothetical protein MELLADRAFT_91393 [Melampsora larici-populina 98AG31]